MRWPTRSQRRRATMAAIAIASTSAVAEAGVSASEWTESDSRWIVLSTSGQLVDVDPAPYRTENHQQWLRDERAVVSEKILAQSDVSSRRTMRGRMSKASDNSPCIAYDENPVDIEREKREDDQGQRAKWDTMTVVAVERDTSELVVGLPAAEVNAGDGARSPTAASTHLSTSTLDVASAKSLSTERHIEDNDQISELDLEGKSPTDEEDEFAEYSTSTGPRVTVNPTTDRLESSLLMDIALLLTEEDTPSMQSAIIFAELSCLFVVFIGYLVRTIPLWPGFSWGQKSCLYVAFSAAVSYQLIALSWYLGAISVDILVGMSSLITRLISLGMIPITTTSFGTLTPLVVEQDHPSENMLVNAAHTQQQHQPRHSGSSRHRRSRTRSC